jgi:UrcA family protein
MNINFNANHTKPVSWTMLAAFAVTLLANAAQAGTASDAPPQLAVRFSDLNLARHADVAVLYRRIQSAAFQVCGSVDPKQLSQAAAAKPCIDRAIAQAVSAINSPLLTSQYLAKTGNAEKVKTLASAR